jgi:sugar phosphate permease
MWSYLFGISRRWEMIFNLCSGVIIVYTLRVNMSVAAPAMMEDLGWSEAEKGFVLSAFYWGYTLGQIPASYYAQAYGCKTLFGLSILIPSVLTILVPFACRYHYALALVVRMTIGFFESASFPAIYHFFPHWIPVSTIVPR